MKKIFILVTAIPLLTSAQNIGTGLSFLKIGVGARSIAMGETFTSVPNDNASTFYNPATLRFARQNEIMLMHREWIAQTTTEYLGATVVGNDITYGLSALATSVGDIEVRTIPGPADGTFAARNFSLGGSASWSIYDDLAVGVTGKFLYEKIFVDEASGYGIDVGALYKASDDIFIGASVLNLGSMDKLRNESSKLPTTLRAGASYVTAFTPDFSFLGAAEAVKTFGDDNTRIHFGAEITYDEQLAVRGGYQIGYEAKSFSAGVGFKYGLVKVDYAFVPFTGAFGSTHTFSLSFLL
ncbi:MAG: PorV/PorQ family protein [Bacteroidota bacterium]|nr:PorV/PorQ family protein [Bacteroidota bacterium]